MQIQKGIKFSNEQIQTNLMKGGLPHLDDNYTVFSEIIEGLDVLNKISDIKTDENDTPYESIEFSVEILK